MIGFPHYGNLLQVLNSNPVVSSARNIPPGFKQGNVGKFRALFFFQNATEA